MSIDHAGLTRSLTTALSVAAHANALGDTAQHLEAIDLAADALTAVWQREPHELPWTVEAIASNRPSVLASDLRSALRLLSARCEAIGHSSPLTHIEAADWIRTAAHHHHGRLRNVAAWCAVTLDGHNRPIRPDGSPIDEPLQRLLDESSTGEIRASVEVSHQCINATAQRVQEVDELLELVRPHFNAGRTVLAAVEQLTGPQRIRAEELLADMPSLVARTTTP
ncbi:MAG: hypothetical protein ACK4V6_05685 [Microthrixaceae bacterium]